MMTTSASNNAPLQVLFLVEGFTDIRYVDGLARICDLAMAIPVRTYESSGLKQRLADCGSPVAVHEIPGGRLGFQARSLAYLMREIRQFDVVLAQEVTRGALSANLAGRMRGVPVLNTLMVAPVDYFRCRREWGRIAWWKYRLGDATIRALMRINARLATCWLALGPYLCRVARQYCPHVQQTHYYGVDTDYFHPVDPGARRAARDALGLPDEAFLVLVSSRVSHEKDPETALRAVSRVRAQGLNAVAINLGGGYREFVALGHELGLANAESWVLGRPAAHPMRELARYYQAADVVVQSSLEEGLGLSPLEALACGIPVVASEVGGMAVVLPEFARLFPRRDDAVAAEQLAWVAANPSEARAQALLGRDFVAREWNCHLAFSGLRDALVSAAGAVR
jgi:glycosyltransferase involved in cell wall biosynthesis